MSSLAAQEREEQIEDAAKIQYFKNLALAEHPVVEGPLVAQVRKLFREKSPQKGELYVVEDSEKNAFCLPNGDVFVSTGLLKSMKSIGQLKFVLGHELSHIKKTDKKLKSSKTLEEYLHQARLEEYSADVESTMDLDRDSNPMEGISALEVIDTKEYGGQIHGDTVHRILNLHWLTKLIDFEGIDRKSEELVLAQGSSKPAPDFSVFDKLLPHTRPYEREIAKLDSIYQTVVAYQHFIDACSSMREMHEIEPEDDSGDFRDDEDDFDEEEYEPAKRHSDWRDSPDAEISRTVRSQLFDKLAEQCNVKGHKPYSVAEVVKALCCGDREVFIRPSKHLLKAISKGVFDELGIVPTYVSDKFLQEYVASLMDADPTSSLPGFFREDLVERVRRLTGKEIKEDAKQPITRREYSRLKEKYDEMFYEDEGGDLPRFKSAFVKKLEEASPESSLELLLKAREVFTEVYLWSKEFEEKKAYNFLEVWSVSEEPLTVKSFEKKGLSHQNALRDWLRMIRIVLGQDFDVLAATVNIQQELAYACTSVQDFKIVDRALHEDKCGKYDVGPVDLKTKNELIEAARAGILDKKFYNRSDFPSDKIKSPEDLEKFLGKEEKRPKNIGRLVEALFDIYPPTGLEPGKIVHRVGTYEQMFSLLPEGDLHSQVVFSLLLPALEASKVQREKIQTFLERYSFEDAVEFVARFAGRLHSIAPFEYLLDVRAKTCEELEVAKELPKRIAETLSQDRRKELSDIAYFEALQKGAKVDRLAILRRSLDRNSDYWLKREMYNGLVESYLERCRKRGKSEGDWEIIRKTGELDFVVPSANEDDNLDVTSSHDMMFVDVLYDLDVLHRYALLRFLLADQKEGVLIKPEYKSRIAKELLEELVEVRSEEDKRVKAFVQDTIEQYVSAAPLHQLYFTFAPLLLDRCFKRPVHEVPTSMPILDWWCERWCNEFRPAWTSAERSSFGERMKEILTFDKGYELDRAGPKIKKKIAKLESDLGIEKEQATYLLGIIDHARSFGTRGREQAVERSNKLGIIEFIKACAVNTGSPGARFLQLLGQFVELPEKVDEEFQEVYDNIPGQAKVTAYRTISREYSSFREEFTGIGERLGGGSQTTVYRAMARSGSDKVVKVLNPNATHQTKVACGVLKTAVEGLVAKDKKYSLGLELLADIEAWIEADVEFKDFKQHDAVFYEKNNGFSGVGGYRVQVPQSEFANKRVKIEEFVAGANLTKLKELESEGHNLKAVIATVAKNYVAQISDGQVHSDVHPGNFRVAKDKKIAILDRNYFLSFNEAERTALIDAAYNIASNDISAAVENLMLAIEQDTGSSIDGEVKKGAQKELLDAKDSSEGLVKMVRYLRTNDVKLPLKYTLLVRNLHSIDKLAKKVGLSGFEEAVLYN